MEKLNHICESCGKQQVMTPDDAFQDGWDYPPNMGDFGVVSPRTCGDCPITTTLYWRLITHKGDEPYKATEEDKVLLEHINNEPESIRP